MIFIGDSAEELKKIECNSIDCVVTDPPYGLKFMNKKWDYDVPSVEIWKECLRVLKPGGHVLSFGGTRTYHRMVVNLEDAGFEIRDQLQWIYGSGFPKSHNLKDDWEGWGTALKPANEPIVLARKPLEKGLTVAENVLKWGVGAINVDETRIGAGERPAIQRRNDKSLDGDVFGSGINGSRYLGTTTKGRWPANIILDESAAEMLDEQSGISPSNSRKAKQGWKSDGVTGWRGTSTNAPNDSGGASRFFYVAKASKRERNAGLEGMPVKESGIKNGSGRGFSESDPYKKITNQNHHPTVKPIKLMEYLIKLVTPPSGTVLDPFMGSGSTGVAAKKLGFKFLGIEINQDYVEIAKKRIEHNKERI